MRTRNALPLIFLWIAACSGTSSAASQYESCANAREPDEAVSACSQLIDSGTASGRQRGVALLYRASAYSRMGEQDRSITDSTEVLRLLPGNAHAYGLRGAARGLKGDLDGAIADFTAAINADPSVVDSFTNRGKALQDKGEFARALPDFDRALKLQPHNPFALNGRCWSHAVLNTDLDAALADCDAGVAAGGDDLANTLNTRGFVHFRRKEYREAIASYDASIERDPKAASSYYIRGLSKRALGEADAAADMELALSLDPGVRKRYAGYGVNP